MDLISEIVATKGSVEAEEMQADLIKLTALVESLKRNMMSDFSDSLLRSILVTKKIYSYDIENLINSVGNLEFRVKTLKTKNIISNSETSSILENIHKIMDTLNYLKGTQELELSLKCINENLHLNFNLATKHLIMSKSTLKKYMKQEEFKDFYRLALEKYCSMAANFQMIMTREWNDLVSFRTSNTNPRTCSICVDTRAVKLDKLYKSLEMLNIPYKENIEEHLLKDFLTPILKHPCSLSTSQISNKATFTIEYSEIKSNFKVKPVIDLLIHFFDFININFDLKYENGPSLIQCLGLLCANDFVDLFIKNTLSKMMIKKKGSLPNDHSSEMQSLKHLILKLTEKGFISQDNRLISFVKENETQNDIKVFSQYVDSALPYIKGDFDLMEVEEIENPYQLFDEVTVHAPGQNNGRKDHWHLISVLKDRKIFPRCLISKSIEFLTRYLQEILEETKSCDTQTKAGLCYAAHEIVYEYSLNISSIPSNPHQSAVVFNNTMYLVMRLVQLDTMFQTGFPFCSLIFNLQNSAFSYLNNQIISEQKSLNSIILNSGLESLTDFKEFTVKAKTTVEECIQHLTLLHDYWINTLPSDIYNSLIGHLCSEFLNVMADVSVNHVNDNYDHLYQFFSFTSDKITHLFKSRNEAEKYVVYCAEPDLLLKKSSGK